MLNYFLDFLIKLFIFEERTHTGSIEMYIKSLPLLYYGKEVWGAIITLLRRGGSWKALQNNPELLLAEN